MTSITGCERAGIGRKVAIGVICASVAVGAAACSGASSSPSATPTTTTPSTATAPPTAAGPAKGRGHGVIGTITAENGSTWTVNARNGTAYTVTVAPQTQFGTRRTPGTAQQFPVGSTVRVSGAANGNTITASRITAPRSGNSVNTPPTSPPS
ncbi:MAG TPA: DUF5666 domain-containing protein [Pseudonocardiaceae bacterium]|jgi:hypothetical protein|nr:DUF5666 domain-containing protein [Pseudonocardiaceae bacterium]